VSEQQGSTWEERMAARARERQQRAEAELQRTLAAAVERIRGDDWAWLNGWPRIGEDGVLMGTAVHCLGCGRFLGVTTVAFTEDWRPPGPEPVWPGPQAGCPFCSSGSESTDG
jgi:hypothetical protein